MINLIHSPAFGLMMTTLFYITGSFIYKKTKIAFFNPLLMSATFLIIFIQIFDIDVNTFITDLSGINVFLGPLIVCLALPIAKNLELIKKNLLPIIVGSFAGAISTVIVVVIMGRFLNLSDELIASIIPKSTTTPIAIEISNNLGGIRAITVAVVVISSVIGTIVIPLMAKIFKINDPLIIGMGLGSTSHAVGTAKALEINPTAGAIAGVALVFSGLITVILSMFL